MELQRLPESKRTNTVSIDDYSTWFSERFAVPKGTLHGALARIPSRSDGKSIRFCMRFQCILWPFQIGHCEFFRWLSEEFKHLDIGFLELELGMVS